MTTDTKVAAPGRAAPGRNQRTPVYPTPSLWSRPLSPVLGTLLLRLHEPISPTLRRRWWKLFGASLAGAYEQAADADDVDVQAAPAGRRIA